jgi:hypothetical protein
LVLLRSVRCLTGRVATVTESCRRCLCAVFRAPYGVVSERTDWKNWTPYFSTLQMQ